MNRLAVAVLLILSLLVACSRPVAAPGYSDDDNGAKPEHGGGGGGGSGM